MKMTEILLNTDIQEKVIQFLNTISNDDNWELHEVKDQYGDWLGNYYTWEKESYDPKYVAQDLLDLIFPNGQDD